MATIMYEMSTTLASTAARPPASDEFPLKTVWTVAKYEPMGTIIMAAEKPRSLKMTSFGTAGLMLDFSSAVSSFSRIVFSELTMRRVAIVEDVETRDDG